MAYSKNSQKQWHLRLIRCRPHSNAIEHYWWNGVLQFQFHISGLYQERQISGKYSGTFPGVGLGKVLEKFRRIFRVISGTLQGIFKGFPGTFRGAFPDFFRNTDRTKNYNYLGDLHIISCWLPTAWDINHLQWKNNRFGLTRDNPTKNVAHTFNRSQTQKALD